MENVKQQIRMIELKNNCVQFMFAYQQKNVPLMMSFCDQDGQVFFASLGETGRGKIGDLGRNLWTLLCDCFPDIYNTVDAIVSEGDFVRCQVLITGTQEKDFAGIENKRKHFESDHIFIFHLNEKEKIDGIEVQWNHEDLVRQLSI
jgi:hypothetical protein